MSTDLRLDQYISDSVWRNVRFGQGERSGDFFKSFLLPWHLVLRAGFLRQTRQVGLLGGATTAGQSLRTISSGRMGRAATTYLPTAALSLVSSGHVERGLQNKNLSPESRLPVTVRGQGLKGREFKFKYILGKFHEYNPRTRKWQIFHNTIIPGLLLSFRCYRELD